MPHGNEAEITFSRNTGARPIAEVWVPSGTTLDVSNKLESIIYERLAPRILDLAPCGNCRSGMDIIIRERFDDVLGKNILD